MYKTLSLQMQPTVKTVPSVTIREWGKDFGGTTYTVYVNGRREAKCTGVTKTAARNYRDALRAKHAKLAAKRKNYTGD